MQNTLKLLARFTGALSTISLWFSGVALVAMTAAIAAQVFWRYMLNSSLMWTEPGSVMIMGWFIFIGAAVGIREGYHLSFDVLLLIVPERIKPWFYTLSDVAVTAFGVGMIWYGSQLAIKTAPNNLPTLGISGAFDFIPIVVGGLLVVLFSLERILRRVAGLPTARFGDAASQED